MSSQQYEKTGVNGHNEQLERVLGYHKRGLAIVPLHHKTKQPIETGWNDRRYDEEMLRVIFGHGPLNVGVRPGEVSGGWVDVDVDDELLRLVPGLLPPTGALFGRKSAPRSHYGYVCDPLAPKLTCVDPTKGEDSLGTIIEFRSEANQQTMFPGSVHPDEEEVEWDSEGEPAKANGPELRRRVGQLGSARLLSRYWEGDRHFMGLALAGWLLRAGWEDDETEEFVRLLCKLAGDEEPEDRVRAVADTRKKLEADEGVTGWRELRRRIGEDGEAVLKAAGEWLGVPESKWGARHVPKTDLWYVAPENRFHYRPTAEMWTQPAVNSSVEPVRVGTDENGEPEYMKPSTWIARFRRAESLTWWPGQPEIIEDHVFTEGGLRQHPGANTLNSYRPPVIESGDAAKAGSWVDHVRRLYPGEAEEILDWLAQKVQHPGDKVNHALVLGGLPGIGKDSVLYPVRSAIGPWNMEEARPTQIMGEQFDSYQRAVILRVNETSDLGDGTRVSFGNHMKNIIANPPEVLSVNEKHRQRHYVPNLVGVVYTTNERLGALFLEEGDRRHLCCWSACTRDDFTDAYFEDLYRWFDSGGNGHVTAFLRERDLSAFNAKEPPRKTEWFRVLVDAGKSSEEGSLGAVLEKLGDPDAVTLAMLKDAAEQDENGTSAMLPDRMFSEEVYRFLSDSRNNSKVKHAMFRAGYEKVDNPHATKSRRWRVAGRDAVIYAKRSLTPGAQLDAAQALVDSARGSKGATQPPVRGLHRVS